METNKNKHCKCPCCKRRIIECWHLPCLELELAMIDGADAVNTHLARANAPFRVENKQL